MGVLVSYIERRLAAELDRRGVVVWYDAGREWLAWVEQAMGRTPRVDRARVEQIQLDGTLADVVIFAGSFYEAMSLAEPLSDTPRAPRLLIYVLGEEHLEGLSPVRELECIGGQMEPFQPELAQIARSAFQSAGLSDTKIDELLNREGLTFEYLDAISVGDGSASPLSPVFGSSREIDVVPAFFADKRRRAEAAKRGLLPEVVQLVTRGLGLPVKANGSVDDVARALARLLLVAEMRSDLNGPEPMEISQIPKPGTLEQTERIRQVCARLRRDDPDAYESIADEVERALGLAHASIDALALGRIDTFRFEERRLLEACNALLAEGKAQQAFEIVEERARSFWTSVSRYPARHGAWAACGELARLAMAIEKVSKDLKSAPSDPARWVKAYTAEDGWHRVDQLFRQARYRLSRMEDTSDLERAAEHVVGRYEALTEQMATGFGAALQSAGWHVKDALVQTEIYAKRLAKAAQPVAYLLVDALRFEMGAELASLLEAVGATALRLEPAIASVPTITDVGMAALLPGAERAFCVAETGKGVTGMIGGQPLIGVKGRMDYARGEVPGLVEMTLDHIMHDLTRESLEKELRGAPVLLVRSQEIDGAGESLPNGVAQTVMGTVLEDIRKGVLRLADAGVSSFVIAADHGHLFGRRRGDDMKIDPPEGGTAVDAHRRCWVGRGGSTPSSCVRIAARDLGFTSDLDIVLPKGTAVFKAGGDLAFHHGGLSVQELVIPILSFELKGKAQAKKRAADTVALEAIPREINNRIFSFTVRRTDLALNPISLRFVAESAEDKRTVGQAIFATGGWEVEARTLTLPAGEKGCAAVSVGIQLDDDEVTELRVLVVEVGTDRTLKDSPPIPVKLLR